MAGSKPAALPLGDTPTKYFSSIWLGYQDSNLGMAGSKPAALPLGDTPTRNEKWLGCKDSNLGMVESESTALPLGDTPINGGYDGIRTCDPRIMSAML